MATYFIRRLLLAIITVLFITLIVFFMLRALPGDPLLMVLSKDQYTVRTPEQLDILRKEYGLDKPPIEQYIIWLGGLFRGDLGKSTFYEKPVNDMVARRAPATIYLGAMGFVFGNFLGIVAGIISALRRGTIIDTIITVSANFVVTIPQFWLGIMMIYVFGLQLGWLPTNGYTSPFENFGMFVQQMIMPVICVSFFSIGAVCRQTRSSMLEVWQQDYIRTAWAKGLREHMIIVKHLIKNGLIPIVTLMGMQLGTIIGGAVLVETVFNIPGMGRLSVDAVQGLDYTLVVGLVLIIAIMVILANLLTDISYGWLDPRIRYS